MRLRSLGMAGLFLCAVTWLWTRAHADEDEPCARAQRISAGPGLRVVYLKHEHRLCVLEGTKTLWSTPASHGRNAGKKRVEGDARTPEGAYTLSPGRASQRFGTFFAISYPNADDIRHARARQRAPGGAVGIHGPQDWYAFLGRWQAMLDHSDGCIVVDRAAIQQLTTYVRKPVPIDLVP